MSSNFIYVTEPKELDPSAIAEALAGSDWQAVSGDVAFTDSTQQPFAALLIRSNTHVDASILEYFPHLKHIVRAGVGLDNIDLDFCASHGITVHNAPGANADAVSDYAIAMMLFALRKLYKLTEEDVVQWNRFAFTGRNLSQQTIGIVGFGNIGKQLYRKLQGFTCREILIFDPFIAKDISLEANARVVDFEELLRLSSVISLHLPLTEHTKYLIGRRNLALLQENAVVINAARGGIVDEAAVLTAMHSKDFVYVADAVEGEPIVNEDLLNHSNIIITPHIASLTDESERDIVRVALGNLLQSKAAVVIG